MPDCLTIQETETANQIILISFDGDIGTDEFPFQFGTDFLNQQGLTISGQARNKQRIKYL